MSESRSIQGAHFIDDESPFVASEPTALIIGNFDGLHLGHQAVLAHALGEARAGSLVPAVLTFDPHPAGVLGRGVPPCLTALDRKVELLLRAGIAHVFVRRFDLSLAGTSPERFARELLAETLRARVVIVGANFRFGERRAGDFATLARLGAELGFRAQAATIAQDLEGPYSSTRVRTALREGRVEEAAALLGRPHAFSGEVVHGAARGRLLGFPTANLARIQEFLPANGVYAVVVDRLDGGARALAPGIMNIGLRPTVTSVEPVRHVEVNLLDFEGDLYGATLRVHLAHRVRDEQKFANLSELRAQIARDADSARRLLEATSPPEAGPFG